MDAAGGARQCNLLGEGLKEGVYGMYLTDNMTDDR